MLNAEVSNQAAKFLKKCPRTVLERITEKIENLLIQPFPPGAITIQSSAKQYRIRIGDYRIIYKVITELNLIHIIKIDKRSRIY